MTTETAETALDDADALERQAAVHRKLIANRQQHIAETEREKRRATASLDAAIAADRRLIAASEAWLKEAGL